MPSGKASKRSRRTVPPPPVRAARSPRARAASPRVLAAAAALIVLIAVAAGLAIVLGGGSSGPSDVSAVGTLADGLPGASDVQALFAGIPQRGTVLGAATAPVTLEEFIDPQCPYCQEFETQVLPSLVTRFVRGGKLKIQMEPWAFIGPDSITGQAAELAAAEQNRVFNYAELLYDNQRVENTGWLNEAMVARVAESIPGLHVSALLQQRGSAAVQAAQQHVDALATTLKISGTPTIFVGKSGRQGAEVQMSSATDGQALVDAITAAGG